MNTRCWIALLATGLIGVASLQAALAEEDPGESLERPRIGLALSGGGARGAAHVGVLRVLEELRIPVDYIAGTSMGSIIGRLYASGMTPDQIEVAMKEMDWDGVFSDRPPRIDRPFRRKRDDDNYLVKARPGFNDGKLTFPSGAFAATEIDGRLLVDGGITNNLPIDVVRAMGADIVIAIDISTPLADPENVRNMLQITAQLTSIMTRANAEIQIASLTERDFLIIPDLGKIGSGDFDLAVEAIETGRVAADLQRAELARLSLGQPEFQAHLAARRDPPETSEIVDFVRIVNNSRVADEVVRARIRQPVGEPLDVASLEADIARLYGLELSQTVHYDFVEEDGQSGIEITANERSWGPNYMQFGVSLTNDLSGDNRYNMAIAYLRTAINPLNGELRFGVQVGEDPVLAANWYQPLDYASNYFFEARLRAEQQSIGVYDRKLDPFAEYRVSQVGAELSAGRNLGVLAEVRVGLGRATGDIEVRVGSPGLPEFDFERGAIFGRILYDSIDKPNFPTSGAVMLADISVSSAIWNGSVFLGLDTPIGPLYLGYGHAEGGRDSAFFYLGKTFGSL